MPIRIIGAVMIFSVSTYLGFSFADRLKKRYVYLRNILTSLNLLETEIGFGVSKLKQAFLTIDKSADTRGLFKTAADNLEDVGIKQAWRGAVYEKRQELYLTDADADALNALGAQLGMTDVENQIKNIKYVRKLLETQEKSAEGEYERLGRLYRGGGILAGLFLILILF